MIHHILNTIGIIMIALLIRRTCYEKERRQPIDYFWVVVFSIAFYSLYALMSNYEYNL